MQPGGKIAPDSRDAQFHIRRFSPLPLMFGRAVVAPLSYVQGATHSSALLAPKHGSECSLLGNDLAATCRAGWMGQVGRSLMMWRCLTDRA